VQENTILLATINARYSHTACGLRWLWANMGTLQDQTILREFHGKQAPAEVAEAVLAEGPRIIGFGVYIWNVCDLTEVVRVIKAVAPEIVVVLGGPEASHEYENTPLFEAADYLLRGEGDLAFPELCHAILDGEAPENKVIEPSPPDLDTLQLPYDAYTDEDIAHRVIYVEASRGCPFRCAFCLSSLDKKVRAFPLPAFLTALESLLTRGALRFKFVDRTFNLDEARMTAILDFFRARWRDGMQLHFEILPDRLSKSALEQIAAFPPEGLHLEVGVQTFLPSAQEAIDRRQDLVATESNLHFLRHETGALLHADLIAGLPSEGWEDFGESFNRMLALRPQAIQVGILKRLKGAPIQACVAPHSMAFSSTPPYEVLQTDRLSFQQLQRIKRFARYFDLYYNAEQFPQSMECLWQRAAHPFNAFMALSDTLWRKTQRTHRFSLQSLAEALHAFLVAQGVPIGTATEVTQNDFYRVPGRKEVLRLED
jgi:hypothetical protein